MTRHTPVPRTRTVLAAGALLATGALTLTACGSGFNDTPGEGQASGTGSLSILIGSSGDAETKAVTDAVAAQPVSPKDPALAPAILEYFTERLRGYYLDGAAELTAGHGEFEAVLARRPASPLDFHQRLAAVV